MPAMTFVEGVEGVVDIGAYSNGFVFDNETPRHRTYLQAHAMGSRLVTNGEYLAFIRDDGYRRSELWLSDGWTTVNSERLVPPAVLDRRSRAPLHAGWAAARSTRTPRSAT